MGRNEAIPAIGQRGMKACFDLGKCAYYNEANVNVMPT